jgi:hypothetical protein
MGLWKESWWIAVRITFMGPGCLYFFGQARVLIVVFHFPDHLYIVRRYITCRQFPGMVVCIDIHLPPVLFFFCGQVSFAKTSITGAPSAFFPAPDFYLLLPLSRYIGCCCILLSVLAAVELVVS